ncbi:MAG: tyrosine-type recombinase/integrase [Ignavibacteriae bacterium]|nr:tyrosine-type recombinase/integrase [Ignavibacteriota bacterium]
MPLCEPSGGTANIRNGTQSEQQQWGSRKNRTIPMHEAVAELLTGTDRTSSFVFADIDGQRLKDFFVTKQVKSYIKKSGVNPKLHFHSFRHTGATWMVQAGISIYTVSKILGHSSVSTTHIYAHWSPDQFHSAVNSIRLEGR